MIASYVQPVKTTAVPADVAHGFFEAVLTLTGWTPSPLAVAVLYAHSALENGNWSSCWNNNPANIKAGEKYDGFYTCIRLNELIDGVYVWFSPAGEERPKGNVIKTHDVPPGHPQTRMRAYATLTQGIEDKIRFLSTPRWRPALDLALKGDPSGYVRAIKALGYFTARLEPYERAVVSLTAKYLPVAKGAAAEPAPLAEDSQLCGDMAECIRTPLPDWLLARANLQVATLGVDWDEQMRARDASIRKDSDPTMPGVRLPDSDPPEGNV